MNIPCAHREELDFAQLEIRRARSRRRIAVYANYYKRLVLD